MKELKFSFFDSPKGIRETRPQRDIDLKELYLIFKSRELSIKTDKVRNSSGEDQKRLKSLLPYITPYGTFYERSNQHIRHYNNKLIAFDFDNLNEVEIDQIREISKNAKNILFCMLSPRGQGIKVFGLLNHNFTKENHSTAIKKHLTEILQVFGLEDFQPDTMQFTLSQAFFLCFDRDMIFNPDATATNEIIRFSSLAPNRKKNPFTYDISNEKTDNIIQGILRNNISLFLNETPGNRHSTLLKNIKAFGMIKQYKPEIENDYFDQLRVSIHSVYESDIERSDALRTLISIRDNSTPQRIDILDQSISEMNEISQVFFHFQSGREYQSESDQISLRHGWVIWSLDGYKLAWYHSSFGLSKVHIKLSGIQTAKKINRLNMIPNVNVSKFESHLFLNEDIWTGEELLITEKNFVNHG